MRLPFLPVRGCCRFCGRDAPGLDREFVCEDCRTHAPHFDRAASSLRFELDARKMMLDFKRRQHLWLRDDFVDFLESVVRARFIVDEIDVVLPMPTTFKHRIDRGYNPTDYLARPLARRLERPYEAAALARTAHPKRQSGLKEEERRENVKGTFLVKKPLVVKDRTVLVVDDVMTTGSTLSACAQCLKASGAARVWCASLCRSVRA